MAFAATARPATLPLPGGRAGATVRVHPLLTGEMRTLPQTWDRGPSVPLSMVRSLATPRWRWPWVPIPAFLVEHPGAGPILVDGGLHASVAHDPTESFGGALKHLVSFRMTADQAVPAQLRARGADPADVALVVMTHLHFDRASGVEQFPDATFEVDRREWETAQAEGIAGGYRPAQFDHPFAWRTLELDGDEARPHRGFARTLDLLGDGSVVLLSTPGHTVGHLSLLLRTAAGEVLLTGDAAYARRTIDRRLAPLYLSGSLEDYRDSLAEIAGYVEAHPETPVICGHDPWCWPELAPVYG